MARGDLDAAVEANVDTWVVGEGRTVADVDPAVTASVRVMQRRAFDIDQPGASPTSTRSSWTRRLPSATPR